MCTTITLALNKGDESGTIKFSRNSEVIWSAKNIVFAVAQKKRFVVSNFRFAALTNDLATVLLRLSPLKIFLKS
jgi:hypothetical protein